MKYIRSTYDRSCSKRCRGSYDHGFALSLVRDSPFPLEFIRSFPTKFRAVDSTKMPHVIVAAFGPQAGLMQPGKNNNRIKFVLYMQFSCSVHYDLLFLFFFLFSYMQFSLIFSNNISSYRSRSTRPAGERGKPQPSRQSRWGPCRSVWADRGLL